MRTHTQLKAVVQWCSYHLRHRRQDSVLSDSPQVAAAAEQSGFCDSDADRGLSGILKIRNITNNENLWNLLDFLIPTVNKSHIIRQSFCNLKAIKRAYCHLNIDNFIQYNAIYCLYIYLSIRGKRIGNIFK